MSAAVFGREQELGSIDVFLELLRRGPAALVLAGEAGIGKTVLWQAGLERARRRFERVLRHRAAEAEATFSFGALSDLLEDVVEEALPLLPTPRRRALEVALLLEEPGDEAPDPRAIALAFLDVLRNLSESATVLIAVDDLQWLDASSARVLQAALRRLRDEQVGLLATARTEPDEALPFELERSLRGRLQRLTLAPLSLGALYRLLEERLGLELTRPGLVRLGEVTGSNPFFAIELGRELKQANRRLAAGEPLPVPGNLKKLLGARLARLSARTRDVLLTAALQSRPTVDALSAAHGDALWVVTALDEAARTGVVELDGSRLRFAHPLLASVCHEEAYPWERRGAHRRLADATAEVEERARHLALATDGPDPFVASALDDAAVRAAARGATAAAAELSELACQLTPADHAGDDRRRALRAADFHRLAGDRGRAAGILESLLPQAASGGERADVLFALARVKQADLPGVIELCSRALAEAVDDDARCAPILTYLSWIRMLEADIRPALADARVGLERAERVGDPELVARAIARVAMSETWTLEVTPDLLERGVEIEERLGRGLEIHASPKWTLARRLMCLDEFDQARILMEEAEANALAHGDEGTRVLILFFLGSLEFMAGRWKRGCRHAETARDLAEQLHDDQLRSMMASAQAGIDLQFGRVRAARAAIERALAISDELSDTLIRISHLSAAGSLELALGNLAQADKYLRPLPEQLMALGMDHPLVSPCWQESIEVLTALGELEQARAYLDAYEDRARRSGAPSARAIAARCRGLLAAQEGALPAAFAHFERAFAEHDLGARPFERARSLLALGSVRRRSKQKRSAREALDEALVIFEGLNARLWAQRARDELARIGGRRPGSSGLTETEDRVAALVAEGLSNKEIASALFVSVHTVEAHLSRVYRKLGVRSRGELAYRLPAKV